MRLPDYRRRIDLKRLSGMVEICGVEFARECIRIVHLKNVGNPLNRFRPSIEVLGHLEKEYPPGTTHNDPVQVLKSAVGSGEIPTKHVIASLHPMAVKSVRVSVPTHEESVHAWIEENLDGIWKYPPPLEDLVLECERLGSSENATSYLIHFVHKREIDSIGATIRGAGLELAGLLIPGRCVISALAACMMGMDQVNALKIVSGVHDHLQVALHENYALVDYKSESFDSDISRRHALDEEIQESYRTHSIVIGGNVERRPEHSVGDGSPDLSIFRLPSRYTVASGLAASFFLPELAGPNFLSSAEKLVLSESIYRRATSRMVLMLGGTFLVMLLATALLEGLMSMRLKTIDEQFEVLGTNYSEIVALEEEIGELNDHLRSDQKLHQHGRVGRILSEVSLAIPNETSLERLDFTSSDTLGGALILVGKSRSIEAVTSFMREIQKSHYMRGVRLVRSGTDASVRPGGASDSRSSTPISFEIRIEVN